MLLLCKQIPFLELGGWDGMCMYVYVQACVKFTVSLNMHASLSGSELRKPGNTGVSVYCGCVCGWNDSISVCASVCLYVCVHILSLS